MKKLAVLFFVFAMSITSTFANNDDDKRKEEEKVLRTQIVQFLGNYDNYENVKAEVTFMLNRKNEIVILSVNSSKREVESFVKARLNYKRVKDTTVKPMKIFKLPIRIVKA